MNNATACHGSKCIIVVLPVYLLYRSGTLQKRILVAGIKESSQGYLSRITSKGTLTSHNLIILVRQLTHLGLRFQRIKSYTLPYACPTRVPRPRLSQLGHFAPTRTTILGV